MKTLIILAAIAVLVASQGARYPANLNPALCPNYPECDNSIIATYGPAATAAVPTVAPAVPVTPAPRAYPPGVTAVTCPNYPYCGSPIYTGLYTSQYPDGVHPAACPNYPYCH